MYRPTHWRATISSAQRLAAPASRVAGRRYASSFLGRTSARATGTAVRWGLAGAAVYYYNTSNVFAEEPRYITQAENNNDEAYSSIDAVAEQRRAQARQYQTAQATAPVRDEAAPSPMESPEDLEQEAEQQGAFNEETGEINWDCPCLGGMAHGPCGEQFRAAFSCFVFSKEEPKGIDCIDAFKTMQNCFREHPDIYGAELTEDEEDDVVVEDHTGPAYAVEVARESINDTVEKTADAISADAGKVTQAARSEVAASADSPSMKSSAVATPARGVSVSAASKSAGPSQQAGQAGDEGGDLVPRGLHDTTSDNSRSR